MGFSLTSAFNTATRAIGSVVGTVAGIPSRVASFATSTVQTAVSAATNIVGTVVTGATQVVGQLTTGASTALRGVTAAVATPASPYGGPSGPPRPSAGEGGPRWGLLALGAALAGGATALGLYWRRRR
jgi:hypothetical protein